MTDVHGRIQSAHKNVVSRKTTLLILSLVTIVTIWFGLKPFNFNSKNHVYWLENQNCVQFQKRESSSGRSSPGVIYSPIDFDAPSVTELHQAVTIEIYVEPRDETFNGVAHILAFGDGRIIEPFIIGQWRTDLEIICQGRGGRSAKEYRHISLGNALHKDVKTFITITSGQERTDVYLNGQPAKTRSKDAMIGVEQLSGHLMLGNASDCGNQWCGRLYGLALYSGVLSPEQVHSNYQSWLYSDAAPPELQGEPIALYTFDEQQGSHVFNQVDDKNHLVIPETYSPLERNMLMPFWTNVGIDRFLLFDVTINVLGFMPFAFFLLNYLDRTGQISPACLPLAVVLAGAIISLGIEISQAYLPIRTSSQLDVICNTCGAYFGVLLYKVVYRRLTKLRLRVNS